MVEGLVLLALMVASVIGLYVGVKVHNWLRKRQIEREKQDEVVKPIIDPRIKMCSDAVKKTLLLDLKAIHTAWKIADLKTKASRSR